MTTDESMVRSTFNLEWTFYVTGKLIKHFMTLHNKTGSTGFNSSMAVQGHPRSLILVAMKRAYVAVY